MNLQAALAYLRQPTTITGISALLGATAATVVHLALGYSTATALFAGSGLFGVLNTLISDNSAPLSAATEKLILDGVLATVENRLAVSMPQLVGDALDVVRAGIEGAALQTTVTVKTEPATNDPANAPEPVQAAPVESGTASRSARFAGLAVLFAVGLSVAACAATTDATGGVKAQTPPLVINYQQVAEDVLHDVPWSFVFGVVVPLL